MLLSAFYYGKSAVSHYVASSCFLEGHLIKDLNTETNSSLYHQRFSVPFEYQVWFTQNLFSPKNPVFRQSLTKLEPEKRHRIVVFIDQGICTQIPTLVSQIESYVEEHGDAIELVTAPICVPGGEEIKVDLQCVEMMQRVLFDHHIDRHSFVVGIGGGALLDAVGWVAATAHRGVRHIRVPTTVLGQNDSGVGVKNGVNYFGVKNYLGTFAPPWAVLNDIEFILSLPHRDQMAGMAEAVKVALIRDRQFFDWLEQHASDLQQRERSAMEYMIRRCAELHMNQIAHGGDPFETGSARPLDYGHWSAHKIEAMTDYAIRHGEAVAIGLALDTRYSTAVGLLSPGEELRVCDLLAKLGFELWHPSLLEKDAAGELIVLNGLVEFKEHLGGELTITLLKELGVGIEVNEIDQQQVLESICWMKDRFAGVGTHST